MTDTEDPRAESLDALLDPEEQRATLERIRALDVADRAAAFARLHEALGTALEAEPERQNTDSTHD